MWSKIFLKKTGIGFSQRDKNVKVEEEKGNLEFRVITNDIYKYIF